MLYRIRDLLAMTVFHWPIRWKYVRLGSWVWWTYWRHRRAAPESVIERKALEFGFRQPPAYVPDGTDS